MAYKKIVEQAIKDGKMVSKSLIGTFEICSDRNIVTDWDNEWFKCINCRIYFHEDLLESGSCPFCKKDDFESMPDIHEYGLTPNQLADYRQRRDDEAAYWRYRHG